MIEVRKATAMPYVGKLFRRPILSAKASQAAECINVKKRKGEKQHEGKAELYHLGSELGELALHILGRGLFPRTCFMATGSAQQVLVDR